MRHSFAPSARTPPVLSGPLAALAELHRDWCLRFAKELSQGFGRCGLLLTVAMVGVMWAGVQLSCIQVAECVFVVGGICDVGRIIACGGCGPV